MKISRLFGGIDLIEPLSLIFRFPKDFFLKSFKPYIMID